MKRDFTFNSSDSKTLIYVTEWLPDSAPKAILQICHGMVEHIGRYDKFASFMAEQGIYVVGNDMIGHGRSVYEDEAFDMHGYFRQPGGMDCVIDDFHRIRVITQRKYPGVPYFVLGFSMGSFVVRKYLMLYGNGLAGALVMGTGSQPDALLVTGKALCKTIAMSKGWHYRSEFINGLAFGSYGKKTANAMERYSWLCRNEEEIRSYGRDKWCGYCFTLNGYSEMFGLILDIQKKHNIKKTPTDFPILLASGDADPVGDFGKGVKKAYDDYIACGKHNVTMKLYPECRHVLLAELNYEEVYADVLNFIITNA